MRSRFYTIDGVTKTLGEWCREYKLPYLRIFMRIKRGMTFEEALTKPAGSLAKPRKPAAREYQVTIDGRTQSLHAWAKELDVSYMKAVKRVYRGWDPERALTTHGRVIDQERIKKRAIAKMIGQRFSKLVVLSDAGTKGEDRIRRRLWYCHCDCGRNTIVATGDLCNGHTKSCGCLKVSGDSNRTHGKTRTRIYGIWHNMIRRCEDPNSTSYRFYGSRGISVCDQWRSFEGFYADMGEAPPKHSIERKDNNGNYEPDNCVWATKYVQRRNTRNVRLITIKGRTQCLRDWCLEIGISPSTVYNRLRRGWDLVDALLEEATRG